MHMAPAMQPAPSALQKAACGVTQHFDIPKMMQHMMMQHMMMQHMMMQHMTVPVATHSRKPLLPSHLSASKVDVAATLR